MGSSNHQTSAPSGLGVPIDQLVKKEPESKTSVGAHREAVGMASNQAQSVHRHWEMMRRSLRQTLQLVTGHVQFQQCVFHRKESFHTQSGLQVLQYLTMCTRRYPQYPAPSSTHGCSSSFTCEQLAHKASASRHQSCTWSYRSRFQDTYKAPLAPET